MMIHVLPGDALAESFSESKIEGKIVVCRECLIEGDLMAENIEDFWRVRAEFIKDSYGESENSYLKKVAGEFRKLQNLAEGSEVNLWFEYELFCQVNMWFCLWLLWDKDLEFYRVAPVVRDENDLWKGFGGLSADKLQICFEQRTKFSKDDIQLGRQLWKAFCFRDFQSLRLLSEKKSACFPHLKKVCEAALEIENRPQKTLENIISNGETDFGKIFEKFAAEEGVYGFGDAQVKRILQEI